MNLNFDNAIPFMEYDHTLAANLDFKSDSCIKALFTDLGTEEIRAITHLQTAHQHLLTVAVRTNQILVDKPLKGVKETELLKEGGMGITTPNSIIDLKSILGSNGEGISSGNMGLQEASRMRLAM
jgi:ribosomal protein S18